MKKVLSIMLIASIILGFSSCTKEVPNGDGQSPFYVPDPGTGGTDPDPEPTIPVGDVPGTFTKKVLIEKMTGEWCGNCPNGGTTIDGIVSANSGKVYAASWQMSNGDPFEIPEATAWRSHISAGAGLSSYGFPSVSVSRNASISSSYTGAALDAMSNCQTQVSTELAKTAECGLAIVSEESGDKLNVDVYVGYNSSISTANTHLTVFLIEDNVPESAPGAQASGGGSYMHMHMVRDVLTADLGDAIDLGNVPTEKYQKIEIKDFDIAGKYNNINNLKILAFINIKGASGDQLGVLNLQEASIGETKKWD